MHAHACVHACACVRVRACMHAKVYIAATCELAWVIWVHAHNSLLNFEVVKLLLDENCFHHTNKSLSGDTSLQNC